MAFENFISSNNHSSETMLKLLADAYVSPEHLVVEDLQNQIKMSDAEKSSIEARTIDLVNYCRMEAGRGSLFDQFLQEYGLSTPEGVTLMRLVEALVRTSDTENSSALVRDKLSKKNWKSHSGKSPSTLVNTATFGLNLSADWIKVTGGEEALSLFARLGDRALVFAIERAMGIMSGHFVLGRTIDHAIKNSLSYEKSGSTFSYDMLGEAAHTQADANRYLDAYLTAANAIAKKSKNYDRIKDAPGVSVKLSALHPRYELSHRGDCVPALVNSLGKIARIAKNGNFGLTIDAEEAARLEVSLEIIEALLDDTQLADWDGLTIVVQAYQKRARFVISWLIGMARKTGRKIAIRLVKGAYWDMEIKRAQELGLEDYPVFTRKENTDLSYLACAQLLLNASDVVFPQFATHNAQTAAAIIEMSGQNRNYEFQRLHGMGTQLHEKLMAISGVKSRIYAPVGQYKDLLPYLVRRLLENGANSSFVNQMLDPEIAPKSLAVNPVDQTKSNSIAAHPKIKKPRNTLEEKRLAAKGWDYTQRVVASELETAAKSPLPAEAFSIIDGKEIKGTIRSIFSPANSNQVIGKAHFADIAVVEDALSSCAKSTWHESISSVEKHACINRVADFIEEEADQFFALCVKEAGKTLPDAIAEVREAVDFCRYYANQLIEQEQQNRSPLGNVVCISPWNFPLAIFLGQVIAALAAGNNVIAKPAEQTPLIAYKAVQLLHRAGIPTNALHLVLGDGATIGSALISSPFIHGVCFTGSTNTAKRIVKNLADTGKPLTPLIAETGGMNAMIIDSTALLEQSVADVVSSAFQSAGQRCSACRIVCVQDTIADDFITMLSGSMELLNIGNPAYLSTDIGPVIDSAAQNMLDTYISEGRSKWKVLGETKLPNPPLEGFFVTPIAFEINALDELSDEKFGPVLHVLRYSENSFSQTIDQINAIGFGLTMGIHTRIDAKVETLRKQAHAGNLYVNRNQIGAVVGVQPFGGEGLSGTGPKAGGPLYLKRLSRRANENHPAQPKAAQQSTSVCLQAADADLDLQKIHKALDNWSITSAAKMLENIQNSTSIDEVFWTQLGEILTISNQSHSVTTTLPGPTGEKNEYSIHARGILLCQADDTVTLIQQIIKSLLTGNAVIVCTPNLHLSSMKILFEKLEKTDLKPSLVTIVDIEAFDALLSTEINGVVVDGKNRMIVADKICRRDGAILPTLSAFDDLDRFVIERTFTMNTTAAGGNASLLAM